MAEALVTVDGQPLFTHTDNDGQFTLTVPGGRHTLSISLVGYALTRIDVAVGDAALKELRIELPEGAGAFEEHVTVAATTRTDAAVAPAGATLFGRDLQALRGVTLDDPIRALHSVPAASSTDDFYSEFAVRGLPFRDTGLIVDGVPTRFLMHSVHGVSDGGSIAMVNSDAVASLSLSPGSYPQRYGRRLGAQVELGLREGDRSRMRARTGLSGTSATFLGEGPIAAGRGSWLVSARRSYLDILLNRIDDENSLAFGFSDTQAKIVFDVTPRHQLQALVIGGASRFDENADDLTVNDEAGVSGRSWLASASWRFTPGAQVTATQRVFVTGLAFDSANTAGAALTDSRSVELGWRGDAKLSLHPKVLLDLGGDAVRVASSSTVRRSINDEPSLTTINEYDADRQMASGYALLEFRPWSRVILSQGARADRWGQDQTWTVSPWTSAEFQVASATTLRIGGGRYHQAADLEQMFGVRAPAASLRQERATHFDLSLQQSLPLSASLQVSLFRRTERDRLWTPGAEPRLQDDGVVALGRGDAPWVNSLDGSARGAEVVLRRDTPAGLSGWASYSFGRHRYTDPGTAESFWSDFDQHHAVSLFGHCRLTHRTSVGAKFRYGSNYPRTGYIAERPPAAGAPPLFGGHTPLFFGLATERNTLRLPPYARLDVRADRTFTWFGRRATLFVEIANVLNRRNLRNVPYDVDRAGRVFGGTDALMPILPSAGFVIEF